MQTVASMAERLDMTAEEAVKALQHMLFEDITGVDDQIDDAQCDLLIDVDEDPEIQEVYRQKRLKEREKEARKKEQRKKAAQKAAANRKTKTTTKKKAKAKTKTKTETKDAAQKDDDVEAPAAEVIQEEEAAKPVAEILPAEDPAEPAQAQTVAEEEVASPREGQEAPDETAPEEAQTQAEEQAKPSIQIGTAIDHEEHVVEVVRADGTHLDVPELDVQELEAGEGQEANEAADEEDEEEGVVAEVERELEEEEQRRAKQPARPLPKPDPSVVAEVIRRAQERGKQGKVTHGPKARADRVEREQTTARGPGRTSPGPTRPSAKGGGKTGKTARKRQRKAERARDEATLRREAAAAVKEYQSGGAGKKRHRKRTRDEEGGVDVTAGPQIIEVEDSMTVEQLAEQTDLAVNDIILELMDQNIMATKNQSLSLDLIRALVEPHGYEVRSIIPEEEELLAEQEDKPEDLQTRAPVITVMGHVDHGKTSLLDWVRKENVAEGEAGGITQHIAAYEVKTAQGRVVFLDTPGHAAFTEMRMRGAQCTDVVVLVVAADDGVMPQTIEAIDHAKAAEVPIVVAVNKCDKPNAQPDKIRQELTAHDLVDEAWGGNTIMRNISALMGDGVDELMEMLTLESEMLELKANPNKCARGAVIESEISRGLGPVAWVLVNSGTLRVGDVFLAGETYGRVRTMQNSRGETVEEAGPSTPVVVTGFSAPPAAGDLFVVVQDERVARNVAAKRQEISRSKQGGAHHVTLEDFHRQLLAGEKKELNIVVKADVQGSVDVIESSFAKLGNEEVKVRLVHSGVGGVNESDVLLASASDAVIIGFHVTANSKAQKLAEDEGVEIRTFRVIYEAIEAVRSALEGMLTPETKEVVIGHAEIRQVFRSSTLGNIAGCYVQDGEITRNANARLVRDDIVVYDGQIDTLRRVKDDVRSVASGFECGIRLAKYNDIKEGDVIEAYKLEEVAKKLE